MPTIVRAERLFDGVSRNMVQDAAVVIEGERIVRLGPAASVCPEPARDGATVITVADGTILPGLIETHTHMHCSGLPSVYDDVLTDSDAVALLRATTSLRDLLAAGVTTVRDIGSKNLVAFTVREAVRRGIIAGPRLLVSGAPITTTGGHFFFMGLEADTVEAVVEAFRAQVKAGADHIKMMVSGGGTTPGTNPARAQYTPAHVRAAMAEARRLHKRLIAHCHATEAIAMAADAGVDDIIHCTWMTEQGMQVDEDALAAIIDKGIFIDPTIAVGYRSIEAGRAGSAMLTPALQARLAAWEERLPVYRRMWERGARFIAGTDSGMAYTPFSDWALTPELFVNELGLSPYDAIRTGTAVAAEAVGMADEAGTLAPGKLADITVVRGDPFADIRSLWSVDTVLLAGRPVKRGGAMLV